MAMPKGKFITVDGVRTHYYEKGRRRAGARRWGRRARGSDRAPGNAKAAIGRPSR